MKEMIYKCSVAGNTIAFEPTDKLMALREQLILRALAKETGKRCCE